jgi:DNA polymerase-3 subunit delta'
MDGFLTVGQPAAVAAVRAMLASHVPHALLLAGPPSVGKLSLALDIAAAQLCTGATGSDRPCRTCRGCRMVEHGNHPDLHRLDPDGPGGQIRIGSMTGPEPGTVRWLASQLAMMPVEAGARVAIIRDAQRMNEDAQSALLKTLEEPPPGVTLILCADDEEALMPTVRSRCARVRLGVVPVRDVERLLARRELADPPTAARLARLAAGRAGLAVAYATAPEAESIRAELARTLLDLLDQGPARRLSAAKDLMSRASSLAGLLAPVAVPAAADATRRRGRARAGTPAARPADAAGDDAMAADGAPPADRAPAADEPAARVPASERRRALAVLFDVWRDLARDLALVQLGAAGDVRDVALLEELESVGARLPSGAGGESLRGLVAAGELLEANVNPELLLDVRLLHWPRVTRAA